MSTKKLLLELNGNNNGIFYSFLDSLCNEPRIAWYPSSGIDFKVLQFLHTSFSNKEPVQEREPASPDLFLFTDYCLLGEPDCFLNDGNQFTNSGNSLITTESVEELPKIDLELHPNIIHLNKIKENLTNRVFF